jgi:hypothetical protein
MEKNILLILVISLLGYGCQTLDTETVYLLNKRLTDLEISSNGRVTPTSDTLNYVIIYVPLGNGGSRPVRIKQLGPHSFCGPNGDIYPVVPTAEQLLKAHN